jgi:methylmalonyl-CoA/ethylmalonyl-CoA epimerase
VTNLEKSVGFYRDVLGIPFLFQIPNLAFFDCGGVRLMLTDQAEGEETQHPPSVLYFKVPDIDAAHAHFSGTGVTFIDAPHKIADMPDHELWMTFFRDVDGYLMGLMAEKPLA